MLWRNNVCRNYLVDRRVSYEDAVLSTTVNRSWLPRRSVLERGMSSGGLVLGGQCIMMDSLTLSLWRRCIESLTMELMVDLLLRWLDPGSALVLALTIPRFYQVYKGLFPQPINLSSLVRAMVRDPSYHLNHPGNLEIHASHGALDSLRFNFWYPASHYIYYSSLKITTQPETLGRYRNFGRFLARDVYAPNNPDGSSSRLNEAANVALKKLKQRYLQWGMYNAIFLRLTGVPLEHPHNLGDAGWNVAVTEMLEGVVATMDKPASLLTVRRKSQLCFPWPARLNRMMADEVLMVFGEWIEMMDF